jgi:hypothetical protein
MEGTFDNLNENVSLKFNNDTIDIIKKNIIILVMAQILKK